MNITTATPATVASASYYLLLVRTADVPAPASAEGGVVGVGGGDCDGSFVWTGPVVHLQPTAAVTIALASLQVRYS